jgi:hypothetical protein
MVSANSPEQAEYFQRFSVSIQIELGPAWSKEYREFEGWCQDNLGRQYNDWAIVSAGRRHYTLFVRDGKWATFLALKHSTTVDIHTN